MKILYTNASKDLDKYYNKVLSIINNNELHLEDDIKKLKIKLKKWITKHTHFAD